MFEKVSPSTPNKIADRVAGAIVDLAYKLYQDPKISVEVLLGHDVCDIIIESREEINFEDVINIVKRITGKRNITVNLKLVSQNLLLSDIQEKDICCADSGIFRACPFTEEQKELGKLSRNLYTEFKSDGKYVLDKNSSKLVICQSLAETKRIKSLLPTEFKNFCNLSINPIGYWTGGIEVDSGCTNREIESDLSFISGSTAIHGKDLSKPSVTLPIYCYLRSVEISSNYEVCCAIGDMEVDGKPYSEIVRIVKEFIDSMGGFERFAEWGLI